MKAFIRDSAYGDLQRIAAWISRDRPVAATRVIQLILANIERLAVFPMIGHAGSVDGTLEWVVPGLPYIIVYTADDQQDELIVIGVFHGAQDR